MSRPPRLGVLAGLLAAACSNANLIPLRACTSDAMCGGGQLCFAEGCADPGSGIVVEVAGSGVSGFYPRDFPIPDGTLGATHDFDLGEPLALSGAFKQDQGASLVAYQAPVLLRAVGRSEYLPEVSRAYEQRVAPPLGGTWKMNLGAGRYAVTALPTDPSVPPSIALDQPVRPGLDGGLAFVFASPQDALVVSGRLLDSLDRSVLPNREVPITRGPMDLQAFDPTTLLPLSQRFPVSSGQSGSNGNFAMTLRPEARTLGAVLFRATPRDALAALPTKEFVVDTPLPEPLTLELGGPGEPFQLEGRVLGPDGLPVDGAQVLVEGVVQGNGTFRSQVAVTDATGAFSLKTLISRDLMTLSVVPRPGALAAATTRSLPVIPLGAGYPEVTTDRRVEIRGELLRPDGLPALGATVRAVEYPEPGSPARPIPLDATTTEVDPTGRFGLRLDAGLWRLEMSAPGLPTLSRLVQVPAGVDAQGQVIRLRTLPVPFQLSAGHTVTGTVRGGLPATPIPWAVARFFRVGPVDGVTTAVLLGTTAADEQGRFSVVLPGQ